MKSGSVSLGEVAERASHLDVACSRCERKGRYRVAKLVADFGKDFAMTDLGSELSECPHRSAAAHHQRCDVYFPELPSIMRGEESRPPPEPDPAPRG